MNIELLREYCMAKPAVTEGFPFDQDTLVFKVLGKMFVLTSLRKWEEGLGAINLKSDPEKSEELRLEYESINPGYHMDKKHWNTVDLYRGELSVDFIQEMIDESYRLVVLGMTKKQREALANYDAD
jgi:predicted DNA-binding protein (MmcQ/YjbR family)